MTIEMPRPICEFHDISKHGTTTGESKTSSAETVDVNWSKIRKGIRN